MHHKGPWHTLRRHLLALILFPLLALAWVGDVLVFDVDLSAFDVVLRLHNWKAEYEYRGVQQMILSDSPQAHYPERALKWGAAQHGTRIVFNPFIYTGMREIAQGTGGFITSPFQLFMDVSEAIDWSTFLRLALAGLFMYGFLVTLGLRPPAAILGGVLWAFNLHQIAWLEFPQHLATQLWIPALLCFNWLILHRGLSWLSVMGILVTNALFFTSGYIQIVLFTYVAIGIFNTIYLAADARLAPAERVRRWCAVHLVFIGSAMVLWPKLAAELQVLNEGLRAGQDWRWDTSSLDGGLAVLLSTLKNMLPDIGDYKRLFSPNFFGGLWGKTYFGYEWFGNVVVAGVYTGTLIFVLVPASLCWLRSRSRRPLIAASAGVLLFSFAMIHEDPLAVYAFQQIPHSGHGGYERFLTLIVFFIAVLAAAGLQVLIRARPRAGQWLFWTLLAAAASSPLIVRIADPAMPLAKMGYPLAVLGVVALGAAALCLLGRWRHLAVLLITVSIVDLLLVTHTFNPRVVEDRNFGLTPTLAQLIDDRSAYRVAEVSRRQLYPPNVLQYYGIASIGGYSTVAPRRYLGFVSEVFDDYHVTDNGQLFFFEANVDIFRLLNVKYVLSLKKLDDDGLELFREPAGYNMYRLKDPLPRAYCASALLEFASEDALLDSFAKVARRYDRPLALVGSERRRQALTANCEVSDIRTFVNGVAMQVTTDAPTYVLVPYNYYPQWTARADGNTIPVLAGNYNFIALPVDAGEHQIRLTYENPAHVVFGIVMAGLGLLVLGWFSVSRERRLTSWLLAYAAVVLVIWGLLEVPGIGNTSLAENAVRPAALWEANG